MTKILLMACFVVFSATTAFAQGNFQLLVSFEEDVKLEFYGFDKNKKQVFAEKSPKKTLRDGNGYWIALIDEDIVFSGQLRYYCVRDVRGKWRVPEKVGKEANALVCDFKPKDIGRGTFLFVPNRRR